jgi:hypothetical protein
MQGRRSQGDIIPGFDCRTGKAVGYVRDEWDILTKELTIERRDCYLIARDTNGLTIYEIYKEPT